MIELEKFEIKLEEYRNKFNKAKEVKDKQDRFDVSFEAEVEDEIYFLAERELRAVEDVYNFVFNK